MIGLQTVACFPATFQTKLTTSNHASTLPCNLVFTQISMYNVYVIGSPFPFFILLTACNWAGLLTHFTVWIFWAWKYTYGIPLRLFTYYNTATATGPPLLQQGLPPTTGCGFPHHTCKHGDEMTTDPGENFHSKIADIFTRKFPKIAKKSAIPKARPHTDSCNTCYLCSHTFYSSATGRYEELV